MDHILKSSLWNRVKTITMPLIIVLSIALANYILTMSTPEIAFTAGTTLGLRVAAVLKALALATPFAGAGIGLGDFYISASTGKIALGLHPIMPFINLVLGFVVYKISSSGKQEGILHHVKNILLLIVYATIMAVLVRINHAMLKFPETALMATKFQNFFWAGVYTKVLSGVLMTLFGYPLYFFWKRGAKEYNKRF